MDGVLVTTAWLAERLDDPDLVVVDMRWREDGSAPDRYRRGHIPGASFMDLDTELSDLSVPDAGRHPLPSPQRFAEAAASSPSRDAR